MGSIFKKVKSVLKNGIEPIEQGRENYLSGSMEEVAKNRALICQDCPAGNFVNEPIDFLKVEDTRIPELSNKMCNECGCASPYLLRQNIKICKYWNDDSKA